MLITSIKKCCKYQFSLYLYNVKQINKKTMDGLKNSPLDVPKKIGRTNKSKKIVRVEEYKNLSFNTILNLINKNERSEKRKEEREGAL